MRVAVVSNRNLPGSPDSNLRDHLGWIDRASRQNVRLVLFPELSLPGFSTRPFMRRVSETLQGVHCQALLGEAKARRLYVAFGLALRRGKQLFISHVLAGPRGLVGHYEKVHLAGGAQGEGCVFQPGAQFKVFPVDDAKVGINICYDGRHPGSSLAVAHLGAEIILHPMATPSGSSGGTRKTGRSRSGRIWEREPSTPARIV